MTLLSSCQGPPTVFTIGSHQPTCGIWWEMGCYFHKMLSFGRNCFVSQRIAVTLVFRNIVTSETRFVSYKAWLCPLQCKARRFVNCCPPLTVTVRCSTTHWWAMAKALALDFPRPDQWPQENKHFSRQYYQLCVLYCVQVWLLRS